MAKTKGIKFPHTQINTQENVREGQSMEEKMRKILETKEPIKCTTTKIYQARKDGVAPECDIRTDRFDIAVEAMNKVAVNELSALAQPSEKEKPANGSGETETNGTTEIEF